MRRTSDVHDFMQQDNETDWDFIWRLAERVGLEFVVEDKVAHFRKPTADDPVALEWPDDPALVQPARHRDPAGQPGDACRPRPQDQIGRST